MRFFLFVLTFLCLCIHANADDAEWREVSTVADFKDAFSKHQNIKLTADIDLAGTPVSNVGTGISTETFDYCNGEICGLKASYEDGEVPYYTIKNANVICGSVKNLKMHHLLFSESWKQLFNNTYNCSFDQIAVEKSGCQVKEYEVSSIFSEYDTGSTFSHIEIINCSLYWEDSSTGSCAGFLAATKSGGSIEHCIVNATCNAYATHGKIGSIVGRATENCRIEDCFSFATIVGNADMCGGIAGYASSATINGCQFFGIVKQTNLDRDGFMSFVTNSIVKNALWDYGYCIGYSTIAEVQGMVAWQEICAVGFSNFVKGVDLLKHNGIIDKLVVYLLGYGCELTDYQLLFEVSFGIDTAMLIWGIEALGQTGWNALEGISGPDEVGGIVGHGKQTSISKCSNYGMVYSLDAYCGGIIGYGEKSTTIKDCLNQGAVHGDEQTGGIAGSMHGGSITTCMNLGNVACRDVTTAGRICGDPEDNVTLSYCCYSDPNSDLGGTKTDQLRISQQDIVSGKAAVFVNDKSGSTTWRQTIGEDHWPNLVDKHDLPTQDKINTNLSVQVQAGDKSTLISAMVNPYSDINITQDIDFEGYPAYNLSSEYMPFCGTINGNGHRVSNISFVQNGKKFALFGLESLWTEIENVGMLSCAEGAKFSNIKFENIQLDAATNMENVSLFVAKSKNCTYDNITIEGYSAITESDNKGHSVWNVGGIVGNSSGDKITNCSIGSDCSLYASGVMAGAMLGGIAGIAQNTQITSCWNAAELHSYRNQNIGGIVGQASNVQVSKCLNTGNVYGAAYLGGIIGQMDCKCNISHSVTDCEIVGQPDNTGVYYSPYIAGFVGYCPKGSSTPSIDHSLVFGTLASPQTHSKYTGMSEDDDSSVACDVTDSYFYGTFNGEQITSLPAEIAIRYALGSLPGELGNWLNEKEGTTEAWYQDIDNNTFPVRIPVPLAAAGRIYKNYDCKCKAISYSNIYKSSAHTASPGKFGLCSVCGSKLEATAPADIHISAASDMADFRYAVNKDQDFSGSTISLDNDIDMKGVSFDPIGSKDHPFLLGVFEGNYHRVKNLDIETTNGYVGLFGCVRGTAMQINNVIIDATCVVKANGNGVAGLLGCVETDKGTACSLEISHCGNEATVSGISNVAGILGAVYTNDNTVLMIENCYNTGTIKGEKESAAICGYARNLANVSRSWNSGKVTGYDAGYPFIRYNTATTLNSEYCYDITGQSNNGVSTFKADDLTSGHLTYLLNNCKDGLYNGNTYLTWCQKIGTDSHPMPKYTSESRVYHHDYSYCDAQTVVNTLYNNSEDAVATIWHDYDENGICTRTAGEIHGEPVEAVDNVWHVTKPGNLYWVAQEVNNGGTQHDIELMNDVSDNSRVLVAGCLSPDYTSFHIWTPIGTNDHPFTKSFNGNYHTISGLYCDNGIDSVTPTGLFGVLQDNPSIADVGVQDCYFRSYWKVGVLAGNVVNSTNSPRFHDIYTIGTVKGVTGIGGVIGYIQDKEFNANSISNCLTQTTVSREKDPTFDVYDQVNNGAFVGNIMIDEETQYSGNLINCFYLADATDFTSTFGTRSYDFAYGDVCHLLNTVDGSELSTPVWGQNLGTDPVPVFTSAGVRHERSVSSNWGTVILPYAFSSNDAVQLYNVASCDEGAGTLTLKPVDTVPANTPCFFRRLDESATSVCFTEYPGTFQMTDDDPESIVEPILADVGWSMVGSYGDLSDLKGVYYMAQDKLWYADEFITLPAYRAYLTHVDPKYLCKSLSLLVLDDDDEVDEIVNIHADNNDEGACYNLAGQRVSPMTRGIVIRNGQKILNK